jgi:hypothetical protein
MQNTLYNTTLTSEQQKNNPALPHHFNAEQKQSHRSDYPF